MARNNGMTAKVLAIVETLPIDAVFLARDLKNLPGGEGLSTLKSIGKCLGYLLNIGQIDVVKREALPGETYLTCFYRRVEDAPPINKKQSMRKVKPKEVIVDDGIRHVRLQDARHWTREPSESRPWRGYTSGLTRIV